MATIITGSQILIMLIAPTWLITIISVQTTSVQFANRAIYHKPSFIFTARKGSRQSPGYIGQGLSALAEYN